jgi:phage terminase small subunit
MLRRGPRLSFDGLPPSPSKLWFYSKLPAHYRRFVDEFIITQNAEKSARNSGLSSRTSHVIVLKDKRVLCAIRERMETITDLASVTAADIRRELKGVLYADSSELTGVWKVPCRHCWGHGNRFQYTNPEMYYIEQAYSYGENEWPSACITSEFGPEINKHARAAYIAGKTNRELDIKGGDGYTRLREINGDCPQCHGQGEPMAYFCDTRYLSEGGRKLFRGVKMTQSGIEVIQADKQYALTVLARDTQVGVERREITLKLPRTAQEFQEALRTMSVEEVDALIANLVTLSEDEYQELEPASLPAPNRFSRGN